MPRDSLYEDWKFRQENPDYEGPGETKEDREGPQWRGYDSSFEIFPHLRLDWKTLKQVAEESGKPIADLGSSFSSLPTEGVLRGIEIIPVDLAYKYEKIRRSYPEDVFVHTAYYNKRYKMVSEETWRMQKDARREKWETESPVSSNDLWKAVQAASAKCVAADANQLPFGDRSLSMVIAQDSVPKHSPDLNTFLSKQLPETLRVTDRAVHLYPLAIYKTVLKTFTPESGDIQAIRAGRPVSRDVLEETLAIYKDPEALARVTEVAERFGFSFALKTGGSLKTLDFSNAIGPGLFDQGPDDPEPMLGVFTRKK